MKKIALISIFFLFAGCVMFGNKTPPKTQLEIREFQTRVFDTKDSKLVVKALLNVLQDEGFMVKNVDIQLGFLSAAKEIDLGSGPFFSFTTTSKDEQRWNKTQVIEVTANVTEFGKQCKVRANFQKKILDNLGAVTEVGPILDEKYYQDFFSKVDKGVFLQKEDL